MSVTLERRFTRDHPCPICAGHDGMPRGRGKRCHGFLSSDGRFAYCTREEYAGGLRLQPDAQAYAHRLNGPCPCGLAHGPASAPAAQREERTVSGTHFDDCPHPYPCDYCDEAGEVIYRVARWRRRDGSKTYSYHHPDGPDRWLPRRGDAARVIYRLPEVRAAIARGETIYIAEGEKCAHLLVALGLAAATNDGGAGKWRAEHTAGLSGASHVMIIPDNDEPGRRHAEAVAAELHGAGVPEVRIVALPDLAEGEGVDNWLARIPEGERHPSLLALVEAAPRWEPPRREPGERPRIVVRNELSAVVDEAQAALCADPDADIYVRGGMLVRVIRDTGEPRGGLTRERGAPIIQALPIDALREALDRAAHWVKRDRGGNERSALPPAWAATTLATRGTWPLPYLSGVVESPVLRPNGTVLDQPGYDADTGLLYLPSADYPQVPKHPTAHDVRQAMKDLLEPLREFPFIGASDRAAALAAILTHAGRHAIRGPCPLFTWRATAPASGKGLGVDVVVLIGTGRTPARMTYPRDPEELRKRVLAIGLEGSSAVLLDNVDRPLGDDVLAAALTAETFRERMLGTNTTATVPLHAVWYATGNNMIFRGDTGRRVIPVDLDPRMEHPEDRANFAHPDLLAWVRENQPRLLVAALTVLRAFHLAGRPRHGGARIGSFEAWDDLVRGACIWAGLAVVGRDPVRFDPAAGRQRIREEDDEDRATLREALLACEAVYGKNIPFTVADLMARTTEMDPRNPELRVALLAFVGKDKLAAQALGLALRHARDRIVGGLCFRRTGDNTGKKVAFWCVVDTGTSGTSGTFSESGARQERDEEENIRAAELEKVPEAPEVPGTVPEGAPQAPGEPAPGLRYPDAPLLQAEVAALLAAHDWEPVQRARPSSVPVRSDSQPGVGEVSPAVERAPLLALWGTP